MCAHFQFYLRPDRIYASFFVPPEAPPAGFDEAAELIEKEKEADEQVRKEIEEDNENSARNDLLTRNYSSSKAFFAMKDKEALNRQEAEKEAAENEKWDAMLANAVDEDGRRAVLAAREQAREAEIGRAHV